jgi:hypothetical protein
MARNLVTFFFTNFNVLDQFIPRKNDYSKKYGVAPGRKLKFWNFGRITVKDLTYEQLTLGLETGIGLGHYQQEISDRESTIMPYAEKFGLWSY